MEQVTEQDFKKLKNWNTSDIQLGRTRTSQDITYKIYINKILESNDNFSLGVRDCRTGSMDGAQAMITCVQHYLCLIVRDCCAGSMDGAQAMITCVQPRFKRLQLVRLQFNFMASEQNFKE